VEKRKILIQIDSDPQPSVFDRIVAIDSGADEVFSYGSVEPEHVRTIVHGAIFTRRPKDLKRTALFIGGTNVAKGERLLQEAGKSLIPQFGLRVSILFDANGANTTAVAAVRAAARHLPLQGVRCLLLGGTGPVGQRAARLLALQDAEVRISSRDLARAASVCAEIRGRVAGGRLVPVQALTTEQLTASLQDCELVMATGAAGVQLLSAATRKEASNLRVAIDLNAVPPLGIAGVEVTDKGVERDGVICYGAIGVGDTKMKIHRAAIARLFESNDQVLDAEEIYELASTLTL